MCGYPPWTIFVTVVNTGNDCVQFAHLVSTSWVARALQFHTMQLSLLLYPRHQRRRRYSLLARFRTIDSFSSKHIAAFYNMMSAFSDNSSKQHSTRCHCTFLNLFSFAQLFLAFSVFQRKWPWTVLLMPKMLQFCKFWTKKTLDWPLKIIRNYYQQWFQRLSVRGFGK